MQQIQFQIVKTNDIYTSIKCVDCGKMKEIILDGDEIAVLNEYCHYCKKEGVLPIQ
jgi:hypothetical protein